MARNFKTTGTSTKRNKKGASSWLSKRRRRRLRASAARRFDQRAASGAAVTDEEIKARDSLLEQLEAAGPDGVYVTPETLRRHSH